MAAELLAALVAGLSPVHVENVQRWTMCHDDVDRGGNVAVQSCQSLHNSGPLRGKEWEVSQNAPCASLVSEARI